MKSKFMSIGELSRRSGVTVKTIRFYSNEGLVPPSDVTPSGYRYYGDEALAQLETIRALRALDVPLKSIAALLNQKTSARELLELRADAIDVQLEQLRRDRALVAQALSVTDDAILTTLHRMGTLARLTALERSRFLARHLDRHLRPAGVDPQWLSGLYQALFANLPEEMDHQQWTALREIIDIVSSDDFGSQLAAQARPFWTTVDQTRFDIERWNASVASLVDKTLRALDDGTPLESASAQALADEMLLMWANVMETAPDRALALELLRQADAQDPRTTRLWELSAIVRRHPPSPHERVFRFLFAVLRCRYGDGS